jgi:hypothetical protein
VFDLLFAQRPATFQVQDQSFYVAKSIQFAGVVLPYDCDGSRPSGAVWSSGES